MEHNYLDIPFAEVLLKRESKETKEDYELLMEEYINVCAKRLEDIKDSYYKIPTPYALGTVKSEKDKLRVEINTYKLLFLMYHNSLNPKGKKWQTKDKMTDEPTEEDVSSPARDEEKVSFGSKQVNGMSSPFKNQFRDQSLDLDREEKWRNSHQTIVQNELESEFSIAYQNLILEWLEGIADEGPIAFSGNDASYYCTSKINSNEWKGESGNMVVKHIDPDARLREQKPIHEYDAVEEQYLLKKIWRSFRTGKMGEADRLCRKSNQFWRAGIISGQELFHNDGSRIQGNSHRFLYLHSLLKLAEKQDSNIGKAVLGGIVGGYDLMKLECSTWYDELWAKLKSNIYHRISIRLLENTSLSTTYNDISKHVQSVLMAQNINETLDQMIHKIRADQTDDLEKIYMPPFELIQTYIITQQFDELILLINAWVAEKTKTNSGNPRYDHLLQHMYLPQLLRFGSHLILFLQAVGYEDIPEESSFILFHYIRHLTTTKQYRLVAYFCSKLKDISHQVYAKIVSSFKDEVLIEQAMEYAQEFFISGYEIVLLIIQELLQKDCTELSTRIDIVDALQYVKFAKDVPYHAEYAVVNKFYRHLFSQGYDCSSLMKRALTLFNDVETDLKNRHTTTVDPPYHNELDEFHQHCLVTRAFDLYAEYKKFLQQASIQPPKPEVCHLVSDELLYQLRVAEYERQHESWKEKKKDILEEFCSLVIQLFTIDNGGLYRNFKSFTPNRQADAIVSDIDNAYLNNPDYTIIRNRSISVLAEAKLTLLSMDVRLFKQLQEFTHLVASHEYRLFNCFTKPELQSFLEKVGVANMKALMVQE